MNLLIFDQNFNQLALIGVDEVGRGPLAGPVVACAVHIPPALWQQPWLQELGDSKKLSAAKRQKLYGLITSHCPYALAQSDVAEIDSINILQASLLAMHRAITMLLPQVPKAGLILIDGNRLPKDLPLPAQSVIKGDAKSAHIAAASIVAKVWRDAHMAELAIQYPCYGWAKNAGYGTKQHLAGLATHGVTPHHRTSFAPVANTLTKA
jgi:ribonuclease HII